MASGAGVDATVGSAADMAIRRVEVWNCSFDLSRPMFVGRPVTRRQYTVVRVTTKSGIQGLAYSNSDNAPLDLLIAEVLAPCVLGRDALDIPDIRSRMAGSLVPLVEEGIAQRAVSLVDICLWDIKSKFAGLPLWRYLGGSPREAVVMLIEGYPIAGEDAKAFAARLAERTQEGFDFFKLVEWVDPVEMNARLRKSRETVGEQASLVVDVNWRWQDIDEAIHLARTWEPFQLAWIEDPFFARRVDDIAMLRASIGTRVGAGDCASAYGVGGPLREIIDREAVQVIRLDVTRQGGFSGIQHLIALASERSMSVSMHAYPEIHQHCVFAWPGVGPLEMFPRGREFDFSHRFVHADSAILPRRGVVTPPDVPGLGLDFDWGVIERAATRHATVA